MPEPKDAYERSREVVERESVVARIGALYDELMHRASTIHARDFVDVPVTMTQAKVLYLLMSTGPLHVSELAGRLGVAAPTASQLVDRMVEQALVDRAEDKLDRRQTVVSIAPTGTLQMDRFRELGSRQLAETLANVADDDLPVVRRALEILIAGVAAPLPAADDERITRPRSRHPLRAAAGDGAAPDPTASLPARGTHA